MSTVTTSNPNTPFWCKVRRSVLRFMERENLSQGEFAERAGISRIGLNRFLKERSTLSGDSLEHVAAAIGYRLDLVVADEENLHDVA